MTLCTHISPYNNTDINGPCLALCVVALRCWLGQILHFLSSSDSDDGKVL